MHDFAACLLAELERWMLNASPAMVDLSGQLVDAPEFAGATGALEAVQTRLYSDEVGRYDSARCGAAAAPLSVGRHGGRQQLAVPHGLARRSPAVSSPAALPVLPLLVPQELKTKKRYGRLQKAMGDYCLLAGSPLDAQDHYSTGGWRQGQGLADSGAAVVDSMCAWAHTAAAFSRPADGHRFCRRCRCLRRVLLCSRGAGAYRPGLDLPGGGTGGVCSGQGAARSHHPRRLCHQPEQVAVMQCLACPHVRVHAVVAAWLSRRAHTHTHTHCLR